jgi:Ca2+-binding EF-hand superfamily protein
MELLNQLTQLADKNGDGKLSVEDLESLKGGANDQILQQLQDKADQNGDGKLDISDLQNLNFNDLLGSITGLFGK